MQTGRADYFGPMVNLSARVAKGTKPGDVNLSSYMDLGKMLSFGEDPSQPSCFLKGTEVGPETMARLSPSLPFPSIPSNPLSTLQ